MAIIVDLNKPTLLEDTVGEAVATLDEVQSILITNNA